MYLHHEPQGEALDPNRVFGDFGATATSCMGEVTTLSNGHERCGTCGVDEDPAVVYPVPTD